ncbi:MAG: hypothetical protein LBH60_03955 [Prevotellaceae bacterium]|nr:hypothetical protein [Prevotellaceae bacterium]
MIAIVEQDDHAGEQDDYSGDHIRRPCNRCTIVADTIRICAGATLVVARKQDYDVWNIEIPNPD